MPSYPRHYATGEAMPPTVPGKLRLYSMQFCPFAQRARLVAEAKGLDYEVINCNLKKKPEWLLERNPNGQVPALEHDEKVLYESLIVADYLDDAYPGRKLKSSDSYQRAQDDLIVNQFGSKIVPAYYKTLRSPPEGRDAAVQELIEKLSVLEKIMSKRAKPFLGGTEVGMVDLMIWPWCHGLGSFPVFKAVLEKCTTLKKWIDSMYTVKAVNATSMSPELLGKFYAGYQSIDAVFDF
ncbi:glutathione S-transferase omega-1-like isoform X2 [Antedon mediterranea]|uniref:glutathione S-transferase omega-1-like isoform X2 n=1 Tax=Antedon mediterranea TaxID=105859 RepID=UPI003AF5A69D